MSRTFGSFRRCRFERLEIRALLHGASLTAHATLHAEIGQAFLTPPIASDGGGGAADLLPDLSPISSKTEKWMHGWTIDTAEQPGHTLLRLTSAIGNLGDGAIEIRGGAVLPSGQEVYQRIFNDMGGFRDVLVGTYTHHPTHDHTHFDNFAQYHLREVGPANSVGDYVAFGDKTSFCLLDTNEIDPAAGPAQYLTCTPERQGISPGWVDVYNLNLDDQWIDITGVPAGTYWLEVVADPDDRILEADETNNVERILIELGGELGAGDHLEENNSFATATDLGLAGDHSEVGLSLHESGDADYFKITAAADGQIDIAIFFSNVLGDINLAVYDGDQVLLSDSTSTNNFEDVSVAALAGETYYIQVYGHLGAASAAYFLSIDGPGSPADNFESNDDFNTAYPLGVVGDLTLSDLSIHLPGNDDYYQIFAADNGNIDIELSFIHEEGGLDLAVYDGNQTLLSSSTSSTGAEHIAISALQGETYYLHVYGSGGALNPSYQLEIDGPALPPDYLEPNDSLAAPYDLGTVSFLLLSGLSIHASGNDDYFQFTAESTADFNLSLAFDHLLGDVELEVYDSNEMLLGASTSADDRESVVIHAIQGDTYLIRAYGYAGATNSAYDLTIEGPPQPDALEVNNTFATASDLGLVGDLHLSFLSIHEPFNDDYYALTAASNGLIDISVLTEHDRGDVDLAVYDGSQSFLADSTSTEDFEQLSIAALAGETYYIKVYGFGGDTNPDYQLLIDGPAIPPDAYEPNDSFATAYDFGTTEHFAAAGLSIHASGNDDYYKLMAPATGPLFIDLSFTHALGNLDVQVLDAAQNVVASSQSISNQEHLEIAATAGQAYVIHVFGVAGATNAQYDLAISTQLRGDYNDDGSVDAGDYILWRKTLNTTVTPNSGADGSGNGFIDHADHGVWMESFGTTANPGAGSGLAVSSASIQSALQPAAAEAPLLPASPVSGSSPLTATDSSASAGRAALNAASLNFAERKKSVSPATASSTKTAAAGQFGNLILVQLQSATRSDTPAHGRTRMNPADESTEADHEPIGSLLAAIDEVFHSFH
jgi:Lysyl oxidase/Bacterial pre-peptidase C-terminal domain